MENTMTQSQVVNLIINTINTIFGNVFSSIDNKIYSNLDSFVFVNSSIIDNSFYEKLLGNSKINGIIYLSDSLLLAISIFYIVRLYYSNFVQTNIEKPYQFIFKLLIFAFFINFSYFICSEILDINFLISNTICGLGKRILKIDISFASLISKLNSTINSTSELTSFDLFSFDGIIKSITSVGLFNLLFSYSVRYIMIQFFVLLCPLSIVTLINSSTSWIFKAWLKCFFSLLILQTFISLILIVVFCINDSNKILFIGSIYALTKVNSYVREIFGGISVDVSNQMSGLMNNLKR